MVFHLRHLTYPSYLFHHLTTSSHHHLTSQSPHIRTLALHTPGPGHDIKLPVRSPSFQLILPALLAITSSPHHLFSSPPHRLTYDATPSWSPILPAHHPFRPVTLAGYNSLPPLPHLDLEIAGSSLASPYHTGWISSPLRRRSPILLSDLAGPFILPALSHSPASSTPSQNFVAFHIILPPSPSQPQRCTISSALVQPPYTLLPLHVIFAASHSLDHAPLCISITLIQHCTAVPTAPRSLTASPRSFTPLHFFLDAQGR